MIQLTNINKYYDSKFQRTYVLKDIIWLEDGNIRSDLNKKA